MGINHIDKQVNGHSGLRALVAAVALCLFLVPAHAQFSLTSSVVQPCTTNTSNACMVVAAYNNDLASYYYNVQQGGSSVSSNGIPNTPIYFAVNGVYQATYYANNTNDPGAITVSAATGQNYGFLGAQYQGSCANMAYSWNGWNPASAPFSSGVYTLAIPYNC